MALKYQLQRAVSILKQLPEEDLKHLDGLCKEIQRDEGRLNRKARPLLEACMKTCEGLCCRNVYVGNLIGLEDLIFILAGGGSTAERMARCLENEDPLFPGDCVFLEGGRGPCIFPETARPEKCIVSFCQTDTTAVHKEVARVKRDFARLGWFIRLRRLRGLARSLVRMAP